MIDDRGRIPVIPLDYSSREKALKKELLIDYTNGKIYVVSSEDKSIIFDLTSSISTIVKSSLDGDDILINIEGVGLTNIKAVLTDLINDKLDVEIEDEIGFAPNIIIDNISLKIIDGTLQIDKFKEAGDGTILQKSGTELLWVSQIIKPVTLQNPTAGTALLTPNATYKTLAYSQNIAVTLSTLGFNTGENYALIKWLFVVGTSVPVLTFGTPVKWLNGTAPTMIANTNYVFEFETFTKGETWFATFKRYA